MLDAARAADSGRTSAEIQDWVRARDRDGVVVLLASGSSGERPGKVGSRGLLFQGILEALQPFARGLSGSGPRDRLTLDSFQDAVRRIVEIRSAGRQLVRCYIPEGLPARTPLMDVVSAPGKSGL